MSCVAFVVVFICESLRVMLGHKLFLFPAWQSDVCHAVDDSRYFSFLKIRIKNKFITAAILLKSYYKIIHLASFLKKLSINNTATKRIMETFLSLFYLHRNFLKPAFSAPNTLFYQHNHSLIFINCQHFNTKTWFRTILTTYLWGSEIDVMMQKWLFFFQNFYRFCIFFFWGRELVVE